MESSRKLVVPKKLGKTVKVILRLFKIHSELNILIPEIYE
jgi:hypothetical protein